MKQERKRDAVWFGAAFGLVLLVALAFGLVQLFAGGWGEQASLPQELGLDGTLEKPAAFWDGHGGFHGDGTAYWEIAFSPEEAAALEKSLQGAQGWQPLPVDGDAQALLYGAERQGHYSGPYLPVLPGGGGLLVLLQQADGQLHRRRGPKPALPELHRRCVRQPEPHPLLRGAGYIKSTKNRNGRK